MTLFQSWRLVLLSMLFFLLTPLAYSDDANDGQNKTIFCQGCHGEKGNSKSPENPSLAGQRASYTEGQLKKYQSGLRVNPSMQSMVENLTEKDIKIISLYYSKLPAESAGGDSVMAKKGQDKFAMCAGCHGAQAQGRGGFPRLAGQQPEYLKKQLLDFKKGTRKGAPMNAMVSALSEQDISEIAAYLGSL